MKKADLILLIFILFISTVNYSISQINNKDELGRRQGKWEYEIPFDSTLNLGQHTITCNFVNDTLQGIYEIHDDKGKLRYTAMFNKGMHEGIGTVFSNNGHIIGIYYYCRGQLIELFRFDKNGNISEIVSFSNSKKNGESVRFNKNKRVVARIIYRDDVVKEEIVYYPNGEIQTKYIYNLEGQLKEVLNYNNKGKIKYITK